MPDPPTIPPVYKNCRYCRMTFPKDDLAEHERNCSDNPRNK